jgi:hypothetical protein
VTPLRVVQWTTGRTGRAAVRGLVGHPTIELIGCYAWSDDKVGRDVGELCGIEPIGVEATNDVEALLARRPECVVYTPYRPDIDHVVRMLESGCNIVSTLYMLSGTGYGEEARARIVAAAARGNASLYTSGVYPGHVPMVALAASAMSLRIERLSILESVDMSEYANEQMFRAMGIDGDPADPATAALVERSCGSFRDQIVVLAAALALDLDEIRFDADFAVADEDLEFGFMTIGKGRVAGIRGTIAGWSGGRARLECRSVWKMGDAMTPNWPIVHGYLVEVEGEPGYRVRIEPLDAHLDGALTTAMPVVNAIPAVCAAPAGVVNLGELPLVRGTHRFS